MSNANEETDHIGKTYFVKDGKEVKGIDTNDNNIIVVNFPGSGMYCDIDNVGEDTKNKAIKSAETANEETKKLIQEENQEGISFYTAIYTNKADGAIKKYDRPEEKENSEIHNEIKQIFDSVVSPLITDDYKQTQANLNRLVFRGHCFGGMVISKLEKQLETVLETKFPKKDIKPLLSAPKALLSNPALGLHNYPKHFQTTAIVNNSDRTITGDGNCGKDLKDGLRDLAGFEDNDLVNLIAGGIKKDKKVPNLPEIKTVERIQENVNFWICSRTKLCKGKENYENVETEIKAHMRNKGISKDDKDSFKKYLKKKINGHEYNFFSDDFKKFFARKFNEAINSARKTISETVNTQTNKNENYITDRFKYLRGLEAPYKPRPISKGNLPDLRYVQPKKIER